MNYWEIFPIITITSTVLWLTGMIFLLFKKEKISIILIILGIISIFSFILFLSIMLQRPPMKTLGETRLWYSAFLSSIGLIIFIRKRYKWLVFYALFMSILFLFINHLHPENYSKTLVPALQSIWFVPHVLVYIFAYALLGMSFIVALWELFNLYRIKTHTANLALINSLTHMGEGFMTLGLICGAMWAKEVWGHYWTWDPKETWALITWLVYLACIHFNYRYPQKKQTVLLLLIIAFVVLLFCWFGLTYFPIGGNSVHSY